MKIEHVALYVKDLESAKKFFVEYFGGKSNNGYYNPQKKFRSYFIEFEGNSRLELMQQENINCISTTPKLGYAHIAFSVGSKEKVDECTEKLKNAGYKILSGPRTTGDGYYESCVVALENNLIEITI